MKNDTYRILAKDRLMSNNTWVTGLNNNDLIIGPSGAGKTRGYVKPNIMQCNESMVIADTKGSLIDEVGPLLKQNGYRLLHLNFKDLDRTDLGYNPLDYVHYDSRRRKYSEQDIMTIAAALVPVTDKREPFWENAAKLYLTSTISYVLECLPKREHSLKYVVDLISEMNNGNFAKLMNERRVIAPESYSMQTYRLFEYNHRAEKMDASIVGILAEKLNGLNFGGAIKMFTRKDRIDFRTLGREKTALFLTISDTDRSMDRLVNLVYTQALHELCASADTDYPDHRLPVPVRFILDDFATNAYIPDFQNIISVIRSREIYVSIILQSITQLNALYGAANAQTIVNNCDNWLYLGGQDVETARFMSVKANKTVDTILNLPLNGAYLFTRGQRPLMTEKFDICTHANYALLPEAREAGLSRAAEIPEVHGLCVSEAENERSCM